MSNVVCVNAVHPIESHAVSLIERALKKYKFPFSRFGVEVNIDFKIKDFAKHNIVLDPESRSLQGSIRIDINGLFLHQYPSIYFNNCIPHELAHIFHELTFEKKGMDVDYPHGIEWQQWVKKINSSADLSSSGPAEFDNRSICWNYGGLPTTCNCDGEFGFRVQPNNKNWIKKLKEKMAICKTCNAPYTIQKDNTLIPQRFIKEVEFINDRICKQASHE